MNLLQIPQPVTISPHRIPVDTKPGFVHLKVTSLEKQLAFYRQVIGLEVNWQSENSAGLGTAGRDLVRLTQIQNGKRYRGVTGLYHFAILFPNRRELARAVARLFALRYPNYPTDHIMTKTTYLDDPEGNNIELYCESPEDGIFTLENGELLARRADGTPSNGREPLNLEELFAHLNQEDRLNVPVPPETRIGHFHLYVSSLETTRRFYHGLLGFDDMGTARRFRMGTVSAGGYHHHIGYNTWQGEGAPPPPPDALGLLYIAFDLPDLTALNEIAGRLETAGVPYERMEDGLFLRDPSQNGVFLRAQAEQLKPE